MHFRKFQFPDSQGTSVKLNPFDVKFLIRKFGKIETF